MEHQKIFPTNIFIEDNFINDEKNSNLNDEFIKNMKKYIEKEWTKRDRKMSHFQTNSFLYNLEAFQPLADLILQQNLKNLKFLGYNIELENLVMSGMWANVLAPGEGHRAHTHSNNIWSGVYYLHSDERTGIVFHDPRPAADVLLLRKLEHTTE